MDFVNTPNVARSPGRAYVLLSRLPFPEHEDTPNLFERMERDIRLYVDMVGKNTAAIMAYIQN